MKRYLLLSVALLTQLALAAQVTLSGKITDKAGYPLIGANVIVKGTYDGASTDTSGTFKFKTTKRDSIVLEASYMGYRSLSVLLKPNQHNVILQLQEAGKTLDDITITAGAFQASDKKKGVTLKPLDIMTTAGAVGDLYGGVKTLPGVTQVGEDGRLFVRGGDGYETKTFIDGLAVKKPYNSSTPDLPSRGRFTPWLFSGTLFSRGGYSAEYGGALSSALILETSGKTSYQQTGISLMTIGLGVSDTRQFKSGSVSVSLDYTNLDPYFRLTNHKMKWDKAPEDFGGTVVIRKNVSSKGLLKVLTTVSSSSLKLLYPDMLQEGVATPIKLTNQDAYVNVAYSHDLGAGWMIKPGVSISSDLNNIEPGSQRVKETSQEMDTKLVVKKKINASFNILTGSEMIANSYVQNYQNLSTAENYHGTYTSQLFASFVEAEWIMLKKMAVSLGERVEYWQPAQKWNAAPRLSVAWQLSTSSQISASVGRFYQQPEESCLRFNHNLNYEHATHYILGYQIMKNDRTLRIEAYQKDYGSMVRFGTDFTDPTLYNNNGHGYAHGIDLFWRDQKSVKNLDYWISYSIIDSRRLYKDYPEEVTPNFIAKHNLSINAKYYIAALRTQVGVTYSWNSGRPYNDPNTTQFMASKAPDYSDLSLSVTYLTNLWGRFTVIYASVSNLLNRSQVYTYRYYDTPNSQGIYPRMAVGPDTKQFAFIGMFIDLKKQ